MKIEQLPVEVLVRIFGYLPTYKRVSLVSRTFYNIACAVNDKNITLSLDAWHLLWQEDLPQLQSIQKTNRKISKVEIRGGLEIEDEEKEFKAKEMETVISIINKFTETIKYLRVEGLTMDVDNFVRILSLVPNAEELVFRNLSECGTAKKQRTMSSSKDLNLKHLNTLEINDCDEVFEAIFNRTPAGVLTELRLESRILLRSYDLFKRQTNIKKLDLFHCVVDPDIFYNMKLESLKCLPCRGTDLVTALSRQTKLKSLKLAGTSTEYVMKFIAPQLTELEKLDWLIVETPVEDIVNISRFKNLQHLTLNLFQRFDIFDAFSELNNSRITTLEIMPFRHQSIDQIRKLATSVPLLKVLKAYDVAKWEQINAIRKHFNFVECLHLKCFDDVYRMNEHSQDEIYLNESECVNSTLTELSINFRKYWTFDAKFIQKLISDYPNLKKLDVDVSSTLVPDSSVKFRLILDGFTKLESLKLHRIEGLAIDDFKYLRDHKKNVKFVSLKSWNVDNFKNQHREELEAMFEVVKISPCNNVLQTYDTEGQLVADFLELKSLKLEICNLNEHLMKTVANQLTGCQDFENIWKISKCDA